jgi:curved DNA-binding protein CbpA
MAGLTLYDILGIMPGASTDEVRCAYEARMSQLGPESISGAPSQVVTVADRALSAAKEAWRVLGDPGSRERYDEEVGIRRSDPGLETPRSVPSEPGWDGGLPGGGIGANGLNLNALLGALGALADWLAPQPAFAQRVVVPNVRGLFVGPCLRAVGDIGLRMETVRLTEFPMPVEGLVVGQSPAPGTKMRRSGTLTVQVWHPPRRGASR